MQDRMAMDVQKFELSLGTDPLFFTYLQLPIAVIVNLKPEARKGVYMYNGHPVKYLDVFGYVVEVFESSRTLTIVVDDGSGAIECMTWKDLEQSNETAGAPYKLGDLVGIKGTIDCYKGNIKIRILAGYKADDYRQEWRRWEHQERLFANCYLKSQW